MKETAFPAVGRRDFLRQSSSVLVAGTLQARPAQAPVLAFYDDATLRHVPADGHPENPRRMTAVLSAMRTLELGGRLAVVASRAASEEDILRVHSPAYLSKVKSEVAAGRRTLSTGDTDLSAGSLSAALAASGSVLSAVDAVMSGRTSRAFCALRPPGHHASRDRGMGFCLFNNVAIGVRRAQAAHGVERVLIADWDVHHGNGTQEVFGSDGSVLFFDTHQHPWYPGTGLRDEIGVGKARGLIVNRPFPAGSGRAQILAAFRDELVPAAAQFKPQLVMVSAGFDSRLDDPLGQFTLVDQDFADLTRIVLDIAREHAGGRIVSVLEGGYALDGLSRAVGAHLTSLAADP